METSTVNNANASPLKAKSRKNSLVELMRFLFSLWVLYFHGYVPYSNEMFSEGKLAVEFFFVLSGFYLMRSIKKYDSEPLIKSLSTFLLHRFKSLSTVFIIGEIFVLIHSLVFDFSYNFLFGYLWYIRDLFLSMAFFFVVKRVLKKDSIFYCFIALLSIFSIFISGKIPGCADWPGGAFRAFASMPLGMLAGALPRLPEKIKDKPCKRLSILINTLCLLIVGAVCLYIISLPEKSLNQIYVLVIIGYPALIYFANQIPFSFGFFNWLGTLSFPIYSFQCILRVIEQFNVSDEGHLFYIIVALVLFYSFVSTMLKHLRKKYTR